VVTGTRPDAGPRFDGQDAGTPEQAWQQDPRLWALPPLDPPPGIHLVVLAAHPDDESLGAGGLVARVVAGGGSAEILVATDGEGSHPHSPTVSPSAMATRRRAESRQAVERLGAGPPTALGLPDGRLAEHRAELAAALDRAVRAGRADRLGTWLVAPWERDRHPDHEAAGEVAAEAGAAHGIPVLQYPIWAWHWADPGADQLPWHRLRAVRLSLPARAAKAAALAAHVSQVRPLSPAPGDEAMLTPSMLMHFRRDLEVFAVTEPGLPADRPDADAGTAGDPATDDRRTLPASYFEGLYREAGEAGEAAPWGLERGWYERRKRALLLAALPRERYAYAVEPGCAVGLLTAELARRCDRVLAFDTAAEAVRRTRHRLETMDLVADPTHQRGQNGDEIVDGARVEVRVGALPEDWPAEWPDGRPDLVVLSEVGYYLDAADWQQVVDRVAADLAPGGQLVACHWRHPAPGYPAGADQVHRALRQTRGLVSLARHEEEDFLLDVLAVPPALSVARAEGLLR
jgi:LmbE family N-acetylglucosaminyl deacetylase